MSCCYRIIRLIFWVYKTCERIFEGEPSHQPVPKNSVPVSQLPWLWIGAELQNDKIITFTERINEQVEYGDVITHEYLEQVTHTFPVKRWLYLDPKTLREEEIPPEGLTIPNDTE